jgi:hypothetical protein
METRLVLVPAIAEDGGDPVAGAHLPRHLHRRRHVDAASEPRLKSDVELQPFSFCRAIRLKKGIPWTAVAAAPGSPFPLHVRFWP